MNNQRLIDISTLLANYSVGNYDYVVPLSDELDEIDSIISNINMLGEELKETTISRDFFSSVFETVTNCLFVLDQRGTIIDTNELAKDVVPTMKIFKHFDELILESHIDFEKIVAKLTQDAHYTFEIETLGKQHKTITLSCTVSSIHIKGEQGYLIVAEDVTEKRNREKEILRAIVVAQENERKRVADDLHDSLGQELSSIKMILGVAKNSEIGPDQKQLLSQSISILEDSIRDVRNICFNLMPSVLNAGGLINALRQLIDKSVIQIELTTSLEDLELEKNQQITIYRVFQEFINNSIKHANATKITIQIAQEGKKHLLMIKDNGMGFDVSTLQNGDGRGLNTMRSRIESFGGKYVLASEVGKGVNLKLEFYG